MEAHKLIVPSVVSENREYFTVGYLSPEVVVNNLAFTVAQATKFHFGVLSSRMHMAWVAQVCGRLESRYRYSNKLIYNTFPWPDSPTDTQREKVETAAQRVLDAREQFPDATLADLYDPLAMPAPLRKAHTTLDKAVDRCYRSQPFPDERRRFEYLFEKYEQLTAPLTASHSKKRRRHTKKS